MPGQNQWLQAILLQYKLYMPLLRPHDSILWPNSKHVPHQNPLLLLRQLGHASAVAPLDILQMHGTTLLHLLKERIAIRLDILHESAILLLLIQCIQVNYQRSIFSTYLEKLSV